jgi:hypothetical protein
MAEGDKGKTTAKVGLSITAGALAALLLTRKVSAATPSEGATLISLDDPAMQALLGLLTQAESLGIDVGEVLTHLDDIAGAINRLAAAMGVVTLSNPPDITAFRVLTAAINVPVQLPDRAIPYDKELVIKALPTNRGTLFVAPNQAAAINSNSSYWIIGNEAVEYKIRNADHIWINAPPTIGIAGEGVVCTVEQESR